MPIGVFQWTVLNFHPTKKARVSVTLTWRGPRYKKLSTTRERYNPDIESCDAPVVHSSFSEEITHSFETGPLRGCLMETQIGSQMPCCFGLAAAISKEARFFLFSTSCLYNFDKFCFVKSIVYVLLASVLSLTFL